MPGDRHLICPIRCKVRFDACHGKISICYHVPQGFVSGRLAIRSFLRKLFLHFEVGRDMPKILLIYYEFQAIFSPYLHLFEFAVCR